MIMVFAGRPASVIVLLMLFDTHSLSLRPGMERDVSGGRAGNGGGKKRKRD